MVIVNMKKNCKYEKLLGLTNNGIIATALHGVDLQSRAMDSDSTCPRQAQTKKIRKKGLVQEQPHRTPEGTTM